MTSQVFDLDAGELPGADGPSGRRRPPPEPAALDPVALAELRATATRAVETAARLSEDGVVKAMNGLREVLRIGAELGRERDSLLDSVSADSEFAAALEEQRRAVSAFTSESSEKMIEHSQLIRESLDQLAAMANASAGISAIAATSRMVTINAKIQAAQLGDEGAPFFVIAREIQQMTERVEQLNAELGTIVGSLRETLPRVESSTTELAESQQAFASEANVRLEGVEKAHEGIAGRLHTFITHGGEANQRITEESNRIITALSFQDPLQQSLRLIADRVGRIVDAVGAARPAGGDVPAQAALPEDDPLRDGAEDESKVAPGGIVML